MLTFISQDPIEFAIIGQRCGLRYRISLKTDCFRQCFAIIRKCRSQCKCHNRSQKCRPSFKTWLILYSVCVERIFDAFVVNGELLIRCAANIANWRHGASLRTNTLHKGMQFVLLISAPNILNALESKKNAEKYETYPARTFIIIKEKLHKAQSLLKTKRNCSSHLSGRPPRCLSYGNGFLCAVYLHATKSVCANGLKLWK